MLTLSARCLFPLIKILLFYSYSPCTLGGVCREAVRQRKALSRTSSNILLNSVQMGHNAHNLNQYHHINYNNHPSECDLNSKLKDLKEETSQNSFSNIEVIHHYIYMEYTFVFSPSQA